VLSVTVASKVDKMGENSVNEVAINMDVGIGGEELDYEANDNIEHEEDAAEKMETNQHERIVKEVSSDGDGEGVNNSALTERTNDHDDENTKDSKAIRDFDSKIKTATEGDVKSDQDEKKCDKKDVNEKQEASSNVRPVCKPCNLVFENKKWLDKHNDSGDHTHVIKGFNPGGGKYYCFLCWLGFEHSEMMLHHIKRSEHITRARRRGVSDVYLKPSPKSNEKPSSQPAKPGERASHRSGSQSQKPSSQPHRPSSQSHKPGSLSHRPSSGSSHRSRSPLRIRLSDYYEVSSVGHCDTSGVRLKSLANGVHKSSRVSNSSEDKSGHNRKDQTGSKHVDKVENTIVSESKSETLADVAIPVNGSADPEEMSGSKDENHDLNSVVGTEPPDIDKSDQNVNQSNHVEDVETVSTRENVSESLADNAEAPTKPSRMET